MKVGVRPWQGYDRAVEHTMAFVGRYFLVGFIPALLLTLVLSNFGADPPGAPVFVHVGSVPILFPGAFLVNFVGLRWHPSRTWRSHPGRAWHAAILSVIFVWAGMFIGASYALTPPEFLVSILGREGAWVVHLCGLVVLLSSLGLAVIWGVPSDQEGDR